MSTRRRASDKRASLGGGECAVCGCFPYIGGDERGRHAIDMQIFYDDRPMRFRDLCRGCIEVAAEALRIYDASGANEEPCVGSAC